MRIYFNPRSHEGSDTSLQVHCTPLTPFQSTLPRGERRCRIACMRSIRNFNPRSHEGSDVRSIDSEPELYYFNPRSHEGSDQFMNGHASQGADFNPRSHEGSDMDGRLKNPKVYDFNPRSHEGSDKMTIYKANKKIYFNPRSHEGSDGEVMGYSADIIISIHAPTRGATSIPSGIWTYYTEFQSTLPRGERRHPRKKPKLSLQFQSTLPRGERHPDRNYELLSENISIHAPTRGAT